MLSYTVSSQTAEGHIITFKDNTIVSSKHIPPNWLRFYVFDSNKIFGRSVSDDATIESIEFLEYVGEKWVLKWTKPSKVSYTLYDDIIVAFSYTGKDFKISSFDQNGNMKELIIKEAPVLKTKTYHKGLLFLFFEGHFYIYNPKSGQLEGNVNGYAFHCKKDMFVDEPIIRPDGSFFLFYNHNLQKYKAIMGGIETNQTVYQVPVSHIVAYNLPLTTPLQSQKLASSLISPAQKLLVFKVVIVVGAVFSILSLSALLLSLRFSSSLVFSHAINLKISMAAIAILSSSSLVAGLILHKKIHLNQKQALATAQNPTTK